MKEAIEFHMEDLMEDNIPIPKPTVTARSIDVAV
jgi:predicted RNase H-like HicB family nuclease